MAAEPAPRTPRRRPPGAGVAAAVLSVTMVLAAACTSGTAADPTAPGGASAQQAGIPSTGHPGSTPLERPGSAVDGIPAADRAAIRRAIGAINATAGGPVPAQRAALRRLVAPAERAKQDACPTAHATLAFQPAYRDLRPTRPDAARGGDYLLPAFITIYHGSRITGTDLTTLRLWIIDGTAHTGALCVS